MKFKTKEEIIKEYEEGNMSDKDIQKSYVFGVIDSFTSFKQRIDFYEKYANFEGMKSEFQPYMQLLNDHPDIAKKWYDSDEEYDEWLFKYCFGGIE